MTDLFHLQNCACIISQKHTQDFVVLENVSLSVREGEVLGLVGRSGSGKSTLVNIMAGLAIPSRGDILWQGRKAVASDFAAVATVLQDDTLFPWLTLQENVLLALTSQRLSSAEKREQVNHVITLMDLDGYEGAYPRELSEAQRQRTALARALAQRPDILLLDEPFTELELLSAENLRTDLIELWSEKRLSPLKAMVLATHAVEEAVLMCDRILLFSSGPGHITHEISVPFRHPRDRQAPAFRQFVDQIYTLMTRRAPVVSEADMCFAPDNSLPVEEEEAPLILPDFSIELMAGLLEALGSTSLSGRADLPVLAQHLQMTLDDLLPLGETLQRLGFAELEDGDLLLTHAGQVFVQGDADTRRDLMRGALLQAFPLLRDMRNMLDERSRHSMEAGVFRKMLEKSMSEHHAQQTLNTAIAWARYGGLFLYDEEDDRFFLEMEE